MDGPSVDPRATLRALKKLGLSRTRIARAVRCDTQTVLCWMFGLPIDVVRTSHWIERLIELAVDVGMDHVADNERFGRTRGYAAEAAVSAGIWLLIDYARQLYAHEQGRTE